MGIALSAIWKIASGIPIAWWICGALFASTAFERHEATAWKNKWTLLAAQNADAKIAALTATNAESARRNTALQGVVNDTTKRVLVYENAATGADARVADSLRQLASLKRQLAAASHSTAASDVQATAATAGMLTDLLGRCEERSAARGRFADAAYSASVGCAAQYESLNVKPTGGAGIKVPGP